ncbi:MAG: ferredoxin [Acidimicrobiales bacterium]|nr:ferredoxin [Acidimicrobiales bacterium]
MALRAEVDHAVCVSSGACVLEAPEAFAYQDGPEALAIVRPGAELSDERLREVADLCPVGAIRLLDAEGTPASPEVR